MTTRRSVLLGLTALAGCARAPEAAAATAYKVEVLAGDLEQPWGMAFLPDGRLLVTEKPGRLQMISKDGNKVEITGVPKVFARGQGGLLDVGVDPDYANAPWIYLSYAEPEADGTAGTAVLRGKVSGGALTEIQVIWRQTPKVNSNNHWGSRLVFDGKGHLFITTGDRASFSEKAQDLSTTLGKTLRINTDGTIPTDNPFVNTPGAKPEIWSYGHRNMQGAFLHPKTGELWTMEHGAQGGDEINLDLPGKNYGWPVISHGVNYNGSPIGSGKSAQDGMEQPLHFWTPSIAPSGMMYYTGNAFPQWKDKLFVGAMKFQYLSVLTLDGNKVVSEEKLLAEMQERVRDVTQGPDGFIYVCFDSDAGRVVRLVPA